MQHAIRFKVVFKRYFIFITFKGYFNREDLQSKSKNIVERVICLPLPGLKNKVAEGLQKIKSGKHAAQERG